MSLLDTLPGGSWIKKKMKERKAPLVSVVRLDGVIAAGGRLRSGLSIDNTNEMLEEAFCKKSKAVAIVVNSPGGSPVQSTLIYKRIKELSAKEGIPAFTFAEDVAASGGYLLMCAGEELFADRSSIIGSIGVITSGFGFPHLLEKIGVERRVYTAGKNKSSLDPFKPEKEEDIVRLKEMQLDVHEAFKDIVREARKDRLNGEEDELMTGEYWAGDKAKQFGLVDGLGDVRSIMKEKFGDKVRFRAVRPERGLLSRLPFIGGYIQQTNLPEQVADIVETRTFWSRYGL